MRRLLSSDVAVALAIFAFALALRLVYLGEIQTIPVFEYPVVDARTYDAWGQRIAAGSWLGDDVFYQAPAYPYFLGMVYAVAGHDLWIAHVVQMLMGALTCVLTFFAAKLFVGRPAGVAAALLLAVYPPAIFFDGLIQKTGLGLFLTTLLVLLIGRHQARPGKLAALLCGGALALVALTRENALAFALLIPVWMALRFRDVKRRERLAWVCTFAVGLAAILGPVALRNQLIGNTFAVTTAQLGPNFYIGNNPRATGVYAPLLPGRQTADFEASDAALLAERDLGRKLTRGEISDYWLGRSLDFIRTEPGRWIALLGAKSLLTINAFEVPDAEDIYTYADWSALLRALLPVLHFGMLVPFAAAGMVLAWRDRRDVWILYLLVAAFAGSVAVFYVFARYRFPLVPLLLPFAGLAIVRGFELASERDYRKLIAPGIVLLAAGFVSNLALIDEARYRGTAYTNLGVVMIENGRLDEAEGYLQGAAEIDAENPDLQFHMGLLRFQQRRWSEAETHLRRMLELADSDFRGHELLARVLRRLGRHEEALNHRRQAIQLDPARGVRGPVGRDQRGRG